MTRPDADDVRAAVTRSAVAGDSGTGIDGGSADVSDVSDSERASGSDVEPTSSPEAADEQTVQRSHRERRRGGAFLVGVSFTIALLFAAVMTALYFITGPQPVAGLTSAQQSAVDAARQEAINLQTYRRSSFDQDFNNALAGMTPDFAKTLQAKKDALQQQLSQGNVDATASALAAGLVSSTATKATVLVVTNSVQTSDDGTTTPFVFSRLQLTLDYTGGKWLVSDLTNIGLS